MKTTLREFLLEIKDRTFLESLGLFVFLNIFLYIFIVLFNSRVPFNEFNYLYNAHHYFDDSGEFNLLRSIGQYDAQWYLGIASEGYPANLFLGDEKTQGPSETLSYAFFPLYPLLVRTFNNVLGGVELSAFIVANVLMIINFVSLYLVVGKIATRDIALKTCFLLFLFPFSIFYRSYFSEGLFLFLLIWFSYFLYKKSFLAAGLVLALLNVTRPNAFFLDVIYYIYASWGFLKNERSLFRIFVIFITPLIPFAFWAVFNYIEKDNALFFWQTQGNWFNSKNILSPIQTNIFNLKNYFSLPFHSFHRSQIDVSVAIVAIFILFTSRKLLPSIFWWLSIVLLALPLLIKDTMSYGRYVSVVFPLFIYIAYILRGPKYYLTVGVFFLLLLVTSLYFVNWYWVG